MDMRIDDLVISYPDFKLSEMIDPEQFDMNNADIKDKVNAILTVLNQITESVTDGNSGANNVGATGFDGKASNPQAMLEDLNTRKAEKGTDWTGTWQGFTPSKADPGISSVVEQHTSQLAESTSDIQGRGINVKYVPSPLTTVKGNRNTGDSVALQAIINAYAGHVIIIPDDTYQIANITIPNNTIVRGMSKTGTVFEVIGNADGFIIQGNQAGIENMTVKGLSDTYTGSLITLKEIGSHVWQQQVKSVFLIGGTAHPAGNGIKIACNTKGIMGYIIQDVYFRFLQYGMYFTGGTTGFINGGYVRNTWSDYTAYSFYWDKATSKLYFECCYSQYTSGYTLGHFKNMLGTDTEIKQSPMWDGGVSVDIAAGATGTKVDIATCFAIPSKLSDKGFRTLLEQQPTPMGSTSGAWFLFFHDAFLGKNLKAEWNKTLTSTGTITPSSPYATPYITGVTLATGATSGSVAQLDFGANTVATRYANTVISSYFKILGALDSFSAEIGLHGTAYVNQKAIILIDPAQPNFICRSANSTGTITDLDTGIPKDNNMHKFQINRINSVSVGFHFDNVFVGEITATASDKDAEPYCKITNTTAADRSILLCDYYMRISQQFTV